MIIATLKFYGYITVTLNDDGIWESTDSPAMAEMLNRDLATSPPRNFGAGCGHRLPFFQEIAKEVAEDNGAEIELATLPPPPEFHREENEIE